jgi:Golgi nucleoside diphosphatase
VPIFFKGTAGLRLLPPEQSKAILDNVADYVTDNYDFIFQPTWVQIISGQDEAVYGWVSVQQVGININVYLFKILSNIFQKGIVVERCFESYWNYWSD